MPPTMESLPTEILQGISDILDTIRPPSLLAFACASKHCYAVASTVLFRTAKVAIADGDQQAPFQRVHDLETRLVRDDAFEHVRRLILCTNFEPDGWPYASLNQCERGLEDDTGLLSCWDTFGAQWSPHDTPIAEDRWEPVIRLVEQLPGLVDLYWVCPERLPLRLLEALQKKANLCRLHHYSFNLGSQSEKSLTSYERALVTSPCLYSIGRMYGDVDNFDFGFESARSIQSPNLKRVYLEFDSGEIQRNAIGGHDAQTVRQSVSREVIQMDALGAGTTPIHFSLVQSEAFGDFSALRVLTLNHAIAPEGLPAPSSFPSLVTLTFTCSLNENVTPQNWDEVAAFLRNLPRLTTLRIEDWDRAISVTPALSPNLRTLELKTRGVSAGVPLRDDHIHKLADLCPNLENLEIEIRRSRGDAAEVARYRSLGRLTRLQELHIDLDASLPGFIYTDVNGGPATHHDTAIEPWFDEQDSKYLQGRLAPFRQGHVRDVLINSAIDGGLARSIFQIINDTKPISFGQPSPLPLERLGLWAVEGGYFPIDDAGPIIDSGSPLKCFLRALNQDWSIERDVRDDKREVLHVHDPHREYNEYFCRGTDFENAKDDQYWFGIWRRVWPVEKEGVDWWKDWKSRPLALDDGGSRKAD